MAYMNQERKALIAADLKKVIPAGWKYSLAVQNHSTLVLTIASAPVDLIAALDKPDDSVPKNRYASVNPYYIDRMFKDSEPEVTAIFEQIGKAMNKGNHDRSDPYTDYFDVGWYISIYIGKWNKPFEVK